MSHALVVGGTGMLRPVTEELARRYDHVSAVARSRRDLEELERAHPGKVHALPLDYRDTVTLRAVLDESVLVYGPITLAVVWVHEEKAPEAVLAIAEFVGSADEPGRYVHVRGSDAVNPAEPRESSRIRLLDYPNVRYEEVILGFVLEGDRSRWLTNAEIANGVLEAIEAQRERTIVGIVEPWNARP
jgi:hypothetical protein